MYLDISYLRPQSQAYKNKYSKFYIKSGTEGMIIRNIFEQVDYEEYEIKLIDEFKTQITLNLPENWKTSDYLKILVSADFQIKKALQNLQIHLNWLELYKTMEPNINQLQKGDFYIFGNDKKQRPVIIIKNLENDAFQTFQYLLETVKRQLLIPYFVENWTIIFDCQQKEYNFYEIDFNFENVQELMINFCGNLNNILIINSKLNLSQLHNYIPNKTQIHSKIKLLTNIDDLQQYIFKEQLEEKYGGECPNVLQFWPPTIAKPSELLKHLTLDCNEDFHTSLRKLQDFKVRSLKKFSSLGRISNQHSKTTSMRKSVDSVSSSSHLKIIVHEENGNQLIQEEIELNNNQFLQADIDNDTKQDLHMIKTETLAMKKIHENNQQQLQTIMENDMELDNKCCSNSSKCVIF